MTTIYLFLYHYVPYNLHLRHVLKTNNETKSSISKLLIFFFKVQVFINDVLSHCTGDFDTDTSTSCSYQWSDADTPQVSSVSPLSTSSGASITITGNYTPLIYIPKIRGFKVGSSVAFFSFKVKTHNASIKCPFPENIQLSLAKTGIFEE